jgi:hypothetical protein
METSERVVRPRIIHGEVISSSWIEDIDYPPPFRGDYTLTMPYVELVLPARLVLARWRDAAYRDAITSQGDPAEGFTYRELGGEIHVTPLEYAAPDVATLTRVIALLQTYGQAA